MHKLDVQKTGLKFGIELEAGSSILTKLRYADDAIIAAQSLSEIRRMLNDLSVFAAAYGLEQKTRKTKPKPRKT